MDNAEKKLCDIMEGKTLPFGIMTGRSDIDLCSELMLDGKLDFLNAFYYCLEGENDFDR